MHLTVFQRSANWVLPKVDRPYKVWEQRLSTRFSWKVYRCLIWAGGEYLLLPAIRGNRLARWMFRRACSKNVSNAISDSELRSNLTPDYPVGAKRVLFSDGYYPALAKANVSLDAQGFECFTERGLRNKAGLEYGLDVVIFGTWYRTNPFLCDIEVTGIERRRIHDVWSDAAHAYLGLMTSGFPNMFML